MLNKLHQLTKITLTAILLAMIAWLAIDVLAIDALAKDASDNNQHHPSLHYVQEQATATPSMDSKLNQVGITQLESRPTECALTRSPSRQGQQNRSFNSIEYPLLFALPPIALIPAITPVGPSPLLPFNGWATAPALPDNHRTLGSCTVTTPADSGAGSLRQCLSDITANGTISFDSQAFPPATPTTISLSSVLPSITTDGLTIDGTSVGVVLDGTGLSSDDYGLGVDSANGVTIKGLQIVNFSGAGIILINGASNAVIGGNDAQARNIISGNQIGVWIGGSSNNNQIIGNYIGTDATGMNAWGNEFGVALTSPGGAQNNIIGGPESEGNLISGNGIGVQIEYEGANSNQVLGNLIGTDATGMSALGNGYGIIVRLAAHNNMIGGTLQGARNIISGNLETGVHIQDTGTNGNQVLGNFIGTDVTGNTRLGNKLGVVIASEVFSQEIGPANNVIGGTSDRARNIISGNKNGIQIEGPQTTNNRIEGNYIGTNVNGTDSVANTSGVVIYNGAHRNIIGGDQQGAGNLISGNDGGIAISGSQSLMTTDNSVQGNYIGTDLTGRASLPNKEGIAIFENAHRNIIGGLTENARNIISGNENHGIWIGQARPGARRVSGTTENQVVGNYIGTDVTGQIALGNERGITLNKSQNNVIGCESLEGCNIISGNSYAGIMMQGAATDNKVIGNFIGTNVDGTSALANGLVGIGIIEGSHDNIIGGDREGKRNVISGNGQSGVDIRHADTTNNQIYGNYIGTDKNGTTALPNRWGAVILQDAHHNIIGGTGSARNLISGNSEAGVQIQGAAFEKGQIFPFGESADHNRVQGNYIGTDVTGLQPLGNRWGIDILAGAKNNLIGGTSAGEGNLISGNLESGIEFLNYLTILGVPETTENQVLGNYIGVGADGTSPVGNGFAGICLFLGTNSNTIGPGNTIAYNADAGVRIQDSNTLKNTITQNSIHHNSRLPIDLIDEPPSISPPILNDWTLNAVSGSTCRGCTIEIFANPDATPAGTLFLATGTADQEGNFTITLPTVPTELSCLSATATDRTGTTEEFSDSLCANDSPSATTTPTVGNSPTATPTVTGSSTATPTATGSSTATPMITGSPTATPTVTGSPTVTTQSNQLYLPLVIR